MLAWPGHFPRIGKAKPIVRLFVLPAVHDGLPKNAVFVAQAVTHRRQLHRGHRIEKAGGQPPKAAVAQSGVGFLFEQAAANPAMDAD